MLGAEQSVIGCLMLEPALLDKARTMLAPKMFEAEPLARIFSCMLKLKKAGMPVDAVTANAQALRHALRHFRNIRRLYWTHGGNAHW